MGDDSCIALADLPLGSRARICAHAVPEPGRLADLGLVPGTPVRVVRRAPLGDPLEIELRGYRLCLRRSEAGSVCTTPTPPTPPTAEVPPA